MGQFKPMIKMETTEPSVELKLKKGGHATHKAMKKGGKAESGHKKMAMGGALEALSGTPALIGRPAVNAPVQAPGKPSMMARRRAMMAAPAPVMGGRMKKGGKAEMESKADERKEEKMDLAKDKAMIKKAFKQHDMQEHKGDKGTSLKLKKGGKMKFATGGSIPSESRSGNYDVSEVDTARPDHSPAKTGDVKNGNAGGYKRGGHTKKMATGGVMKANGGGYATGGSIPEEESYGNYDTTKVYQASKKNPSVGTGGVKDGNGGGYKRGGHTKRMKNGGDALGAKLDRFETKTTIENDQGPYDKTMMHGGARSKKHFATGGSVNNTGRAVAMPQGSKKAPTPVMISQLSGTYRNGGKVTRPEAALLKANKEENSASMKAAKKYSVDPDPMIFPASRMKRGGRC